MSLTNADLSNLVSNVLCGSLQEAPSCWTSCLCRSAGDRSSPHDDPASTQRLSADCVSATVTSNIQSSRKCYVWLPALPHVLCEMFTGLFLSRLLWN